MFDASNIRPHRTKIGLKALPSNTFHILLVLVLLCLGNKVWCQDPPFAKPVEIPEVTEPPLEPLERREPALNDSIIRDTLSTDSLKAKPPILSDKIKYRAKDYVTINQKEKKIYLHNEAELYYQDTELKAGIIILDYENSEAYAGRIRDSIGELVQYPVFKQGADVVNPDSIKFNYKTKKALIWNSRSEQAIVGSSMNVFSELTKKENDSVYYLKEGKITTSKDIDNPEYYIRIRKAKFVPKKKIIAGFSNMYIADVPTPIGVPFAYFPLSQSRTSGLIFPTFGENNDRGYFLQNGGYYFAISDYLDLAVTGDYYTNGSYGLRNEINYARRYRFRGAFNLRFENLINSQPGFPDFSRSTIYNIQWRHSQDAKANPNSRFSASVNLGSSTYYRESVNQLNTPNFINNSFSSSISWSKTFPAYPSVNLSLTATHQQNTNTELINMTLPSLQASMERVFPLAPKEGSKKGAIQNINFQYNVRAENRIATTEDNFFSSQMFQDAKIGARHTIPVNTNFKVLKYLSLSMGGTYEDIWTLETIRRNNFNAAEGGVTTDTLSGFDRFHQYNFSTSLGTTIYGTFNFGEDKKIQAIRHVVRPSISWGFTPAFNQFYEDYVDDEEGNIDQFTRFEGGIFGVPGRNKGSSIGISVNNTLEAKVRSKDSTALEPKKITLLNNLNFSTSYNLVADSLQWSPVRMSGSTAFFDGKMSVNFGATLDPYAIDNSGRRINTFNINNGGSLFRLTNANINTSYSLTSAALQGRKETGTDDNTLSGGRDDDLFGRAQNFSDSRTFADDDDRKNDDVENPYYATALPWNLRLAYTVSYSNSNRQNEISNHSLMFSGNIEPAPRWKLGFSSGYDFKGKGFTYTQLRFERDLKSWRLNFNWVPFSTRASWYFFIGIKGSLLSDIKWEKRSEPDRQL